MKSKYWYSLFAFILLFILPIRANATTKCYYVGQYGSSKQIVNPSDAVNTVRISAIVDDKRQTVVISGIDNAIGSYSTFQNGCPKSAYLCASAMYSVGYNFHAFDENYSCSFYINLALNDIGDSGSGVDGIYVPNKDLKDINFCGDGRVLQAFRIGGFLLFAAKILVPLIIIILGSIDFAKAVINTGDKASKEAVTMLVKRLIIGVIIFLLPTILDVLLGFIDGAEENSDSFSTCTHCLFDPFDSDTCVKPYTSYDIKDNKDGNGTYPNNG